MIPPWYVKMVLKNLENENGCETMFLHSDSPSCLHYKGLPSSNLGVCTQSYWKKQTRKNMEHIRDTYGQTQLLNIWFKNSAKFCFPRYSLRWFLHSLRFLASTSVFWSFRWRVYKLWRFTINFQLWRTCLLNHHHSIYKITVSYGLGLRVNEANKPRAYWPPNKLIMRESPHPLV